jgi:acetolactate decarboxylase
MAIDERLIGALHVEAGGASELGREHEEHVVFQASTFAALLDGAYDGDVAFVELEGHGDLGLGTLNAVDGEMILVDGRFLRADADGWITEIPSTAKTPFAVLTFFDSKHRFEVSSPTPQAELLATVDERVGHLGGAHAVRIEGAFARVHARSVPKQSKPYPSMVEVAAAQHAFDFAAVDGTMVGFRFPDYAAGINVPGYHLHFVTADRDRGGHVLDFSLESGTVEIDDEVDVHVELPPGIEIGGDADPEALRRVEREG